MQLGPAVVHVAALARRFVWDLKRRDITMEETQEMDVDGREPGMDSSPQDGSYKPGLPEENEVRIVGRLVNQPKVKDIEGASGVVKMARFTMAVNRTYRDAAGRRNRETAFVPVVAWRGLGQRAAVLGKGSALRIEGRIKTWEVEGRKYRWEVQANVLEVLELKPLARPVADEPPDQGRPVQPALA